MPYLQSRAKHSRVEVDLKSCKVKKKFKFSLKGTNARVVVCILVDIVLNTK